MSTNKVAIDESAIQHVIDHKTKPLGALGSLETLALKICKIQNTLTPKLVKPRIIVFAADHGLSQEGVSAYPSDVTAQMVLNFVNGGAAINVFSRQHGIELDIVDAGVNFDFDKQLPIAHKKVAKSTRSSLSENAMTDQELKLCYATADQLIDQHEQAGSNVIGFGEMGIGNTSAASLIQHYLLGTPLEDCVGKGTGLTDEGLTRKLGILKQVKSRHGNLEGADHILRAVGGFEIAMMTQAMLRASQHNMLVLVDGFIASAAALLAVEKEPNCRENMVFCHQSEEIGHQHILTALKAEPILKMNMRLGEGSGCALAYPLLESAVNFMNEMASFESAAVSQKDS